MKENNMKIKLPQRPKLKIAIREPFLTAKPVALSELKNEEKIPKENIVFVPSFELGRMRPAFSPKCTVRKQEWYNGRVSLTVLGEYGGGSSISLILFAMVYNAENRLIGYAECSETDEVYNAGTSFSKSVLVPRNETISKIILRFVRKES